MYKFGDKIQVVGMSLSQYKENIQEQADDLLQLGWDYDVNLGDLGIVISSTLHSSRVAFEDAVMNINNKDLMPESEESHALFLETVMDLQSKCSVQIYDSLDHTVEFHAKGLSIGCQEVKKDDAIKIANDILTYFKVA